MVLELYTNLLSTNGKRVAIVLNEKEVPFELLVIDFTRGEHKAPAYLEKQPFGQVPYIDDDGFILYESRAICLYIEAKYRNQGTQGLVPTELRANALFHQAVSIEMCHFNIPAQDAAFEKLWKEYFGQETDQAVVDRNLAILDASFDVYEKILSKQKYLTGDTLTLADLYHIPYAALLPAIGYSFDARPNVSRYLNELLSRKSALAVKDGVKGTVREVNM